ncbi:hypothetical protein MTO96_016150 [Rhipicephalus appendiculatus]
MVLGHRLLGVTTEEDDAPFLKPQMGRTAGPDSGSLDEELRAVHRALKFGTVQSPVQPGACATACHRATYRGGPVDENVVREGDPLGRLAPRQRAAALIRGLQHSSSWVSAAKHITQNTQKTGNDDHRATPAP